MTIIVEPRPPQREPRNNQEEVIQVACVDFFTNNYTPIKNLLYAAANETNGTGKRFQIEGEKKRRKGTRPGVADLCLVMARHNKNGLYIELKKQGGVQSDKQKEWQALIEKENYLYKLCYSLEDFVSLIEWYIGKPEELFKPEAALKSQE